MIRRGDGMIGGEGREWKEERGGNDEDEREGMVMSWRGRNDEEVERGGRTRFGSREKGEKRKGR